MISAEGLVIKGIGGFYYVRLDRTEALGTGFDIIEAKGRGSIKNDGIKLHVGDQVKLEITDELNKKGVITEVLERKNQFIRPPIVNVDTFIVTMATTKPKPNLALVDKFLIMAEMENVEVIICINKSDLVDKEELKKLMEIYDDVYSVIPVSAKTCEGIDELKKAINGKKVAFAGSSGVGKSSIINLLHPAAEMETGEISKKTSRGKHTTRHVEIFNAEGGGLIYDTPGFTSFDILQVSEEDLRLYYPEFEKFTGCYYDNCKHITEPDCKVKEALKEGKINKLRYESYKANLEEIRNKKKY